jgi:exoribonuclease R
MNRLNILQPNYAQCGIDDKLVDGEVVFQNKLFHGDLLNEDYSLRSSQRSDFLIGGVIKLKNTYTFGKGDLFEFVPINWRFPKFLVRSNIKKKKQKVTTNYFVVIKFKEWTDKIPHGMIVHSIGTVDDVRNQYEVLFYYYPTMTISPSKSLDVANAYSNDGPQIANNSDIFTIDPSGCEDMDDALSFDHVHNRIGIHITDVTVWVDDKFIPDQYFTVYAPHTNIHMLPADISTRLASLKEGEYKNVITCWIDIQNGGHTFEVHRIHVTKNLTYEEAETLVRDGHPTLDRLWHESKKIGDRMGIEVTDTHKMIEVYMVYYNQAMAVHLKDRGTIYRSHRLHKRAFYTLEHEPHEQLNLSYYTHATSPIRRYADFLVQRLFKGDVSIDRDQVEKINAYETNLKRLYRMWDYTKASQQIENGKLYGLNFQNVEEERILFSCEELHIVISMKIPFEYERDNNILIYGKQYRIGDDYRLPLYVIEDTKHTMFHKILIEFPK